MREIKFRGKNELFGWVYGEYFKEESNFKENILTHFIITNGKEKNEIHEDTLGQYTGFKDKNGKEIYEGDILYHKIQGKRKVYYPVFEENASYGLLEINTGMVSFLENTFLYEIIGNIYENKELMEE